MGGFCCAPKHHHVPIDKNAINMSIKFVINEQTSKSMKQAKSYLDFDDFQKKFEWEDGSDIAKDKKYKQPYQVEILDKIGFEEIDKVRTLVDHFKNIS